MNSNGDAAVATKLILLLNELKKSTLYFSMFRFPQRNFFIPNERERKLNNKPTYLSPNQTKPNQTNSAKPKIDPFEFSRNLEEGMRAGVLCAVISGQSPVDIR